MRPQISKEGVLLPHDWDEEGRLSKIALLSMDEGEYVLDGKNIEQEMFQFVHHRVEVNGTLARSPDGIWDLIRVGKFRVLSDSSQAFWEETTEKVTVYRCGSCCAVSGIGVCWRAFALR